MARSRTLNFDCLELIFALLHGSDLASVSRVCKSWLQGVVPWLYRNLPSYTSNMKRYPKVTSPFDTLIKHPNLATHVRSIDIHHVPRQPILGTLDARFMSSLCQAITLCKSLRSFICLENAALPPLLIPLRSASSLESLRVDAALTPDQGRLFLDTKGLKNLTLDAATWNVVDILPQWTTNMSSTLNTLNFHSLRELNEQTLLAILMGLPRLKHLHVIQCTKIEHLTALRALVHNPELESLSITTWDSRALPPDLPHLHNLSRLVIDTRLSDINLPPQTTYDTPALWTSFLSHTASWHAPISSLAVRVSERATLGGMFLQQLVSAHGKTLQRVSFMNCDIDAYAISILVNNSPVLEQLGMNIPAKDFFAYADVLSQSKSLEVLRDVGEVHTAHGVKRHLDRLTIQMGFYTMQNLKVICADGRIWMAARRPGHPDEFTLKLERRKNVGKKHWYLFNDH